MYSSPSDGTASFGNPLFDESLSGTPGNTNASLSASSMHSNALNGSIASGRTISSRYNVPLPTTPDAKMLDDVFAPACGKSACSDTCRDNSCNTTTCEIVTGRQKAVDNYYSTSEAIHEPPVVRFHNHGFKSNGSPENNPHSDYSSPINGGFTFVEGTTHAGENGGYAVPYCHVTGADMKDVNPALNQPNSSANEPYYSMQKGSKPDPKNCEYVEPSEVTRSVQGNGNGYLVPSAYQTPPAPIPCSAGDTPGNNTAEVSPYANADVVSTPASQKVLHLSDHVGKSADEKTDEKDGFENTGYTEECDC